jgi:hypothetical protein
MNSLRGQDEDGLVKWAPHGVQVLSNEALAMTGKAAQGRYWIFPEAIWKASRRFG